MLSEDEILSVGAKSREPYEAGNGRVYDPIIGRFLSPDPVIQAPDFTQNYNSYSYCLNNPLKYIDPNGYSSYNPYAAYINAVAQGYGGKYQEFSSQYWNNYIDIMSYSYENTTSGGSNSSPKMTYTWIEETKSNDYKEVGDWIFDIINNVVVPYRHPGDVTIGAHQEIRTMSVTVYDLCNKPTISSIGMPLGGGIVGEGFGGYRPSLNDYHKGIDILGEKGTPIKSLSKGTILNFCSTPSDFDKLYAGQKGGYFVQVLNDGYVTYYCHLMENSTQNLTIGMQINQGDIIGNVGNSGRCLPRDCFHVHIQVWPYNTNPSQSSIDPILLYPFLSN